MEIFDLHSYFDSYESEPLSAFVPIENCIGEGLVKEEYDVAIIGVPSEGNEETSVRSINEVRRSLYQLSNRFHKIKLCDLGNLKSGAVSHPQILSDVIAQLVEKGVVPILLSGSDHLMVASDALSEFVPRQALSIVDSRLGLKKASGETSVRGDLLNAGGVSSVNLLGYQNYYSTEEEERIVSSRDFDFKRLRDLTGKVWVVEPYLRDSHLIQINMTAAKYAEAPLKTFLPNGLTGVELCQIGHYAGLSDSAMFYELSGLDELPEQSELAAALAAQLIWHIIEGVENRYGDYPLRSIDDYQQYVVLPKVEGDEKIVFYNNRTNGRWWIEIPTREGKAIYSCTQKDYLDFCGGQIPDIWMKYYMR